MNNNTFTLINKPALLYENAEKRYLELLAIVKEREAALAKYPPGKIHIIQSRKSAQFYLRREGSDKSGKYISKKDVAKIRKYVQKSYDEKVLKLLSAEIKGLEALLSGPDRLPESIQKLYSANKDEVKRFIRPIDMSDEDYAAAWMSIPFRGKAIEDHVPFYETGRKERVRSKSELNIANALADRKLPYKYECPLELMNGAVMYPDFTILDVKNRKVIYWEHRGMMDDRDYAKRAVYKLKSLMNSGIFPGRDLIISEETASNPLGTNEIDAIINEYFPR